VDLESPFIVGLRDTDSAADLKMKLAKSKRVCVLGNGGIATELIYELKNIDVIWVIRDKYIASAFVDGGAAEFLMNCADDTDKTSQHAKSLRYTTSHVSSDVEKDIPGCALGPNWHVSLELTGALEKKNVSIEYQTFIKDVNVTKPASCPGTEEWPVYVTLNNGKVFGCDFVISATGVSPSIPDIEVSCHFKHLFLLHQAWLTFNDFLGGKAFCSWKRWWNIGKPIYGIIYSGHLCCRRCLHS
jgi:small subunit ribosomal protein S18b